MKVLLTHPTGSTFVRALLRSLIKENKLVQFATTLVADESAFWIRFLPEKLKQEWLRRAYPISSEYIWSHPGREAARMLFSKMKIKKMVRHEHGWASVYSVYKDFDKAVATHLSVLVKKNKIDAVYAYEDGALETFIAAKKLGIKCIYDLPIAYWETGRRLLTEEANRLPEWAITIGGGILDSPPKLERKRKELEMADMVIGPGSFVLDSLPEWARNKKVAMIPFGSPTTDINTPILPKNSSRRLRVLFVGSMGQRKGLGDLFAAIKLLDPSKVELVVMGSLMAPIDFYRSQFPGFTYEAGRPHAQVLELMRSCDVFCLPSIIEGRALVMQEAMSQGLPIIITKNTGGADLIKEGETGFLVPIRSPEAIAEKISWFIENRNSISAMGEMARSHASTYTWEKYGKDIVAAISSTIE